jgi:hypothetical protein
LLTPHEAALRGRIGAYTLHSRRDPRQTTEKARSSFLATFERQVDPERVLPEPERLRRAESARKAHFARMALASARARAKGGDKKNTPLAGGAARAGGSAGHAEPSAS